MDQWRRLRLWLPLALVVVLIVGVALWLSGTLPPDRARSPLPTPLASEGSPVPAPLSASLWRDAGIALLWVALGVLLALGVVFILTYYRRFQGR